MSTVVFVHAHPDDEALLTAGTMARLSAHGHRVVLIMATDGAAGLVSGDIASTHDVAALRESELQKSGQALGVQRTYHLGYADSGLDGQAPTPAGRTRFADADPAAVAEEVVNILAEEGTDVLVGYDRAGGYGHPDHVQVHRVCRLANDAFPFAPLLEASLPREPLLRVVKIIRSGRWVVPALGGLDIDQWSNAYLPKALLEFRVDVRPYLAQKRASLAAHASQATGDDGPRTLAALLKLPAPLFRKMLGHEYFHKASAGAGAQPSLLRELFGTEPN